MISYRDEIVNYISQNTQCSSSEIFEGVGVDISYATLRRELSRMLEQNLLVVTGKGRSSRYSLSPIYTLVASVDVEQYFQNEVDQRDILEGYNFSLIELLGLAPSIFTNEELAKLEALQAKFAKSFASLTPSVRKSEMDRLGIDLSWKSSQIEGNTYSLLETELLLKEQQTAQGKSKDEATMLLNHKAALDFILEHPDYLSQLSVAKIEAIHSILIDGLDVDRNLRRNRVGITGTNYRPLENELQIVEALHGVCKLVNESQNIFEKALLILLLISYIQPFGDGNKRTARIVSNAILIANGYCPLSFRSVDSIEYKKAMLIFYERNNLWPFKQIFIEQFEFAVEKYF